MLQPPKDSHAVPFTVIVNGQPINDAQEDIVPSSGDRMVCFSLPRSDSSTSRVEIIGTTIAPEFGSLALAITAITITGLIAFRAILGNLPKNERF